MSTRQDIFNRCERLVGNRVMERLAGTKVILFGVGGVGSWCAESLIRSGIGHLTLVDSDRVCASNINRQLMATTHTVGQVKVDALKERLLEINPEADIDARQEIYAQDIAEDFGLDGYDYIIDAIDSLENKASLIRNACETRAVFFSSMGAALKMDPSRVAVAEFWKVKGCPLAAALRRKFKRAKLFPKHKFNCVYSDELLKNLGDAASCLPTPRNGASETLAPGNPELADHDWTEHKAQVNGTMAHITAIFGFTLAGLVIQDIQKKTSVQTAAEQ